MAARVILITGSTRGIGEAAAAQFLKKGDRVVIFCRHKVHGLAAFQRLAKIGKAENIFATDGDVGSAKDASRIVQETVNGFGGIDVLINNAGVAVWRPFEDTSEQEWDQVISTNLKGNFLFIKQVLAVMKKQGQGTIINISSGLGVRGAKNYSAYCASKFGIIALTQVAADEAAKMGIKVYAVLPGAVATRLHLDFHPWEDASKMMAPEYLGRRLFEIASENYREPSGGSIEIYK